MMGLLHNFFFGYILSCATKPAVDRICLAFERECSKTSGLRSTSAMIAW